MREAGLKEQGKKQEEVKGDTKDTQQEATDAAPEAAESLGQAARQMQKSEDKLDEAKNAPDEQQAAIDALEKAEQQLAEKIDERTLGCGRRPNVSCRYEDYVMVCVVLGNKKKRE